MPQTSPVKLGPWTSMNNRSEIGTIQDDQLALVQNLEFDSDKSLVTRPAITQEETVPLTGDLQPLGYYVRNDGTIFLVVATATDTRIYDMAAKTWTTIWSTAASDFVQYDNKIVMCARAAAGGYWEAGTFTATSTMPPAEKIVVYKERFWAFGPTGTATQNTVYFSNITVISPAQSIYNWTVTTDFFTVGLGDGQRIVSLVTDPTTLLIFKNGSTYAFDYPTAPSSGSLRRISSTIGATNRWSVGSYENYYIVYWAGTLYQFIQQRYYPLNTKTIEFSRTALANPLQADVRLSIFGDRALLWYYGTLYCYGLTTNGWSFWIADSSAAHFFMAPAELTTNDNRVAIAVTGENVAGKKRLWRIEDGVRSGAGETFTWMVRTKAYPFGEEGRYKRLMWWLASVRSARPIAATANPIALPGTGVTWDQMATKTWDVLAMGTWTNPFIAPATYVDNVSYQAAAPYHVLVKIRAALHALSISFDVSSVCDGTAATGPGKLYGIESHLMLQSEVSRKVS